MQNRIKAIRLGEDITQIQMAQALGVRRSTIASYESGVRAPSNSVIASICRVYNVREEWLRTGEGEMYEESPGSMLERLAEERNIGPGGQLLLKAILRAYEELGEEKVIQMIYEMLPLMSETIQQIEAEKVSRVLSAQDEDQAQSAQG